MKILCKTGGAKYDMQAGQQVNKIGQYLYKHIDGAFKIEKTANTCDVYFMLLYQIPQRQRRFGHPEDREMKQMDINLSITTYQNKIRVNVIEVSPEERTLGCYTYRPEELVDLEAAKEKILKKVINRVSKVYEDYDFVF